MICWSCERAAGDGAWCTSCEAIQPPDPKADWFAVLGVPPVHALDLADAEARFRELSRRFHPDRFAKADPRARGASLQRSVQLNEAWRALKDPVRRAEYLLERAGFDIGRLPVPPALLGEILELREHLCDARAAGDDARVQEMAADMRGRVDATLARVADGLGDGTGTGTGTDRAAILEAVAGELVAIRYFRRFLDEVAVHDEAIAAGAPGHDSDSEAGTHA